MNKLYDNLAKSPHVPSLSWVLTWCMNGKQLTECQLDYLRQAKEKGETVGRQAF